MNRLVVLLTVFFLAIYSNGNYCIAADNVDISFSISSICYFDLVPGDDPEITINKEDIGITTKTDSFKKYQLSTNLKSWKIEVQANKEVDGITIKVKMGDLDSGYSGNPVEKTLTTSAQTVLTGTNGGLASSNPITYSAYAVWGPNAGKNAYTITYTISAN